jgi:Pyruvate/2-oxoacid:ferredoxin oxidoreductase delta subunit
MFDIDHHRCLACAGCIGLCPEMALTQNLSGLLVRLDLCSLCGICVDFCPMLALTIRDKENGSNGVDR